MTAPTPQNPAGQAPATVGPQGDPAGHAPPTPALGSQPQPPAPAQPAVDDKKDDGDEPLGPAGKKALEAERAARQELEKQLKALAPLQDLAAKLGSVPGQEKDDATKLAEQMAEIQKQLDEERSTRLRLEVAAEKKLTPQQAARLVGATREELAADADALLALFPQRSTSDDGGQPGTGQPPTALTSPKPDPSQGRQGHVDLNGQIAAAEASGKPRDSIALKNAQLLQNMQPR